MQTPPDPKYLAFLASCVDECDKEHSPEEVAAAEQVLRESIQVPQFDLILGSNRCSKTKSIQVDRPYFGVRWVKFPSPFSSRLPNLPCCYCVFVFFVLLYIGQTVNLSARFARHRVEKTFTDSAIAKVRFGEKYGDWAMREMRLIRKLQPPMNLRVV